MLPSITEYPDKPAVDLHALGDREYQEYSARVAAIIGRTPAEVRQSVEEATPDRSDYGKLAALAEVYVNAQTHPQSYGFTHEELDRRRDMLADIPGSELVNLSAAWTESGEMYLAADFDTSQRVDNLQRDPDASMFSFPGKAQDELDNMPPLAQSQVKAHLEAAHERLQAGDYPGCTNRMLRARAIAYRYSAMNLLGELDNRVQEVGDHANGTHDAAYASRRTDGVSAQDDDWDEGGMTASYMDRRVAAEVGSRPAGVRPAACARPGGRSRRHCRRCGAGHPAPAPPESLLARGGAVVAG